MLLYMHRPQRIFYCMISIERRLLFCLWKDYHRKKPTVSSKGYPDVLDIKQMCEILGISLKTGYSLIQENELNA